MKFKIQNNGQIGIYPAMGFGGILKPCKADLEDILCAVKNTQEKLMNKDIQEQDSKNKGIIEGIDIMKFSNGITLQVAHDDLVMCKVNGTKVKLG